MTGSFFESDEPEVYSLHGAGQFSVQYRNGFYTTLDTISDNATLQIRRTNIPFQYELTVRTLQRPKYASLQTFPVQDSMQLKLCRSNCVNDRISITWYNEEHDELFDFSCDESVENDNIKHFVSFLYNCIYENSCQKHRSNATEADIRQWLPAQFIPKTSSNVLKKQQNYQQNVLLNSKYDDSILAFSIQQNTTSLVQFNYVPYKGSKLSKDHSIAEYVSSLQAELHEYIPRNDSFVIKADVCTVDLARLQNNFTFALIISSNQKTPPLSQIVDHQMNPNFNKAAKSFTWNYLENGKIYSLMLKVSTEEFYDDFSASFAQCLFESSTRIPFRKSRRSDQNYVIAAFGSTALDHFDPLEYSWDEEYSDTEDTVESYESLDGDPEEVNFYEISMPKNPILLSACKSSRLIVIEGSNIATYRQIQRQIQFSGAFYGIKTLKNQDLIVSHAILYQNEQYLLLLDSQNPHNINKIHKFDFSQGKVVEEWQIEDEDPLLFIAPSFKSASQTEEQTICGMTSSAVFRIDPRQPGKNKIVVSEYKKHITKTYFAVATSTESGYLAVAGKRGDIRLFSALNTVAKTTFPPIGEPILSLDTTNSGRYIIATCTNFLILVDVEGQYMDEKTTPIILRLKSEHVMLMKRPAKFSKAYFDLESHIIVSTGQCLVMWNLGDVLHGRIDTYKLKKLDDTSLASCHIKSNNIVVAFGKGITQIPLSKFKTPCFESLVMKPTKDQEYLENL
ncbi:VID27 cytoplasmic protein-domain-containing protein [Parasitella parasitica]|nr:VID27 cytoplasmic protein-domain-containing protein [Parasitella parasitica]